MFESEAVYSIEKLATQKAEARFAKEEERMAKLLQLLRSKGEIDLMVDAYTDKSLRRRLYKEYNIK